MRERGSEVRRGRALVRRRRGFFSFPSLALSPCFLSFSPSSHPLLPYVDRHRDLGLARLQVVDVGRRGRPPALERDRVLREAVGNGREECLLHRRRSRRRFRRFLRRRRGARRRCTGCCCCCARRCRGCSPVRTPWPWTGGTDDWWAHAGLRKRKGKGEREGEGRKWREWRRRSEEFFFLSSLSILPRRRARTPLSAIDQSFFGLAELALLLELSL